MPSRNPYGCVFCPIYLLAFFFLAARGAFFLAFVAVVFLAAARGFFASFTSGFDAAGGGASGAAAPATRISTWLVRLRIGVPRSLAAPVNRFRVCTSFSTAEPTPQAAASHRVVLRLCALCATGP